MLYKILEAHDGKLPDDVRVTFANTGKEMPETLDFVQACSDHWGVDIVWLEYAGRSLKPKEEKKSVYEYSYKVVNHKTASRNGEPFTRVIQDVGMLPDPRHRWCTGQLKINTMKRYLIDENFDLPFLCLIGLRADEPMRVAKIHGKIKEGQENYCPMYVSGESKQDVFEFWETQNFDLNLPNNKGVTDWGNCDLCFLKSKSKKLSIMRERPDLAQWWVDIEKKDKVDVFNRSHGSYEQMQIIATDQGQLFDFDDDPSIPCFCGD
jgi:3'-phosphoadenosine 5'-phosphosulfate sulfotransferase (PAPS reductase)/FAD synthetase